MDAKAGIMMGIYKGRMHKEGHYDIEMKGWMKKGHYDLQIKGQKDKGGLYDVEL